jgi:riboflavin kinase / FMN adenylyltransferase
VVLLDQAFLFHAMQHVGSINTVYLQDAWLTIGTFDGVHRGHQEIIRQLTDGAHAKNVPAVVLTFDPHPVAVLRPDRAPLALTSADERAVLLGQLGVNLVITHPFTQEVATLSARDFLTRIKEHLRFTQFWVGYDFAMGRNREGTIPVLRELGEELGYQLHVVEPVDIDGKTVSSSKIRMLLTEGNVQEASVLLGRPYQLAGPVIEGAKRGRTIGIPTANLAVDEKRAIPARGVYVCRALVNGSRVDAVTNIGLRPTFENGPVRPSVEAHLLNFSSDLYGQVIQLEFLTRLRDEQKFSGVEALVQQIQLDIAEAKEFLGNHGNSEKLLATYRGR